MQNFIKIGIWLIIVTGFLGLLIALACIFIPEDVAITLISKLSTKETITTSIVPVIPVSTDIVQIQEKHTYLSLDNYASYPGENLTHKPVPSSWLHNGPNISWNTDVRA